MSPPSTPIFLIPMASKPVRKFGNLVRLKFHLPTAWLQCSRWCFKRNDFTFNGDHYLHIHGTAMGTKMAPSYANTFMRKFEKQLLESSIERPLYWYRCIDDVDMKWTQSDEELQNFPSRANNLNPSLKFTHKISNTIISFLDTSSSLSKGELSSDLYSKPTDTNQYLLHSSCHPPHVTKSIPYSQALRIRRICSTDKSLKKRLGQLKNHLKRGYKQSIIKKSFIKAHSISRSSLLQYKEKQKCKRTPCVLTYHPCLRNSFNTIREHWTFVEKNSKLFKVFPEPPPPPGCLQTTKQSEKPVGAVRNF